MENNTTETNAQPIVTEETPIETKVEDYEAKVAALEAEKTRLVEESANYKMAYFKEKSKRKENFEDDEDDLDAKIERTVQEKLKQSRLAEIAFEQDAIIKKALKENKELKLAQLNKTVIPASTGTHTENQEVKSTLITPEQLAAFKAKGWSDKDIERYKKNLQKYAGR